MLPNESVEYLINNADLFWTKWDRAATTDDDWYLVLLDELFEWRDATQGRHEHKPELEIIQLGGVLLNIMRKYTKEELDEAVKVIRAKHFPAEEPSGSTDADHSQGG